MKYVLLQPRDDGMQLALFTLAPLTHAQLAAPYVSTHTVKSAGFCMFSEREGQPPQVRVWGYSESLKAESHQDDARVIGALLHATLKTSQPIDKEAA